MLPHCTEDQSGTRCRRCGQDVRACGERRCVRLPGRRRDCLRGLIDARRRLAAPPGRGCGFGPVALPLERVGRQRQPPVSHVAVERGPIHRSACSIVGREAREQRSLIWSISLQRTQVERLRRVQCLPYDFAELRTWAELEEHIAPGCVEHLHGSLQGGLPQRPLQIARGEQLAPCQQATGDTGEDGNGRCPPGVAGRKAFECCERGLLRQRGQEPANLSDQLQRVFERQGAGDGRCHILAHALTEQMGGRDAP